MYARWRCNYKGDTMSSAECKHPTCSGPYCRRPKTPKKVYTLKRTPLKKKPNQRLKAVSEKRKLWNEEYKVKSEAFRAAHPKCQVNSPECTGKTEGVHHMKGKTSYELLLDETLWMAACNRCNVYIEIHDSWAREKGYKLSKFN